MAATIHIEMPSGAVSRKHSCVTDEEAVRVFNRMISQMRSWPHFTADVVLMNEIEEEVRREHIEV